MFQKLLTALLVAALLAVAAAGICEPAADAGADASRTQDAAGSGDASQSAADAGTDASQTEDAAASSPARGYVLVSTATQTGWLPLPDEEEYTFDLKQVLPDGTEALNVIHLTPEGVFMEDSTCENHDCVNQGEVTLENKADRILGNMIICLPNQVYLQLFTPEEVLEMAKSGQIAP